MNEDEARQLAHDTAFQMGMGRLPNPHLWVLAAIQTAYKKGCQDTHAELERRLADIKPDARDAAIKEVKSC